MLTTPTATTCQAVDQIVAWDQVRDGDIALHNGQLKMVDSISTDEAHLAYLAVRFDGTDRTVWVRRSHRTAVTRYVEAPADA